MNAETELDASLARISQGIDRLAAERDRLRDALRAIYHRVVQWNADPLSDPVEALDDVAVIAAPMMGAPPPIIVRGHATLPAILIGLAIAVLAMYGISAGGGHLADFWGLLGRFTDAVARVVEGG